MSSSPVREFVLSQLEGGIPAGWRVDPGIPTLNTLSKPILWLEYTSFEREPSAPLSKIACGVDVCIATNLTDMRKGEDEADEMVAALFEHMVVIPTFREISARKSMFGEQYIGWRISITVVTTNPTPESEE